METYIVEGNISVKAVLQGKKRKVLKVIVDPKKKDKDTAYILRYAKKEQIEIEYLSRNLIDQLAQGNTHGGILAICSEREYQQLSTILHKKHIFLALIEGVEDPFNFGYILRTLYAAGCDGVIVSPRNWTTAVNVVTKSSAGASEHLSIFIAHDMEQTLQQLKQHQIQLVLGQRSNAKSLYDYTFPDKVCIGIGGELRGLSKLVQSYSDQNLYIPYQSDFKNAMTAATSTAIFAFEYVRQRQKGNM